MVAMSLCSDFSNVVSIKPLDKPTPKYLIVSNVSDSITSIEPITIIHLNYTLEDCKGGDWVQIDKYPTYEIYSVFPHLVRKLTNGKLVTITFESKYWLCHLNDKKQMLHCVVAEQFIPNPLRLKAVDHINGDRKNHSKDNLKWVSLSQNRENVHSANGKPILTLTALPEPCVKIPQYNEYWFDKLWDFEPLDKYFTQIYNGEFKEIVVSSKEYKGSKRTTVSYYISPKDIAGMKTSLWFNKLKPIVEALLEHWYKTQCESEVAEYGDEAEDDE
jgi:hypothetical protein